MSPANPTYVGSDFVNLFEASGHHEFVQFNLFKVDLVEAKKMIKQARLTERTLWYV